MHTAVSFLTRKGVKANPKQITAAAKMTTAVRVKSNRARIPVLSGIAEGTISLISINLVNKYQDAIVRRNTAGQVRESRKGQMLEVTERRLQNRSVTQNETSRFHSQYQLCKLFGLHLEARRALA